MTGSSTTKPNSKRRRVMWLAAVAVYLGFYIVLSLRGRYLGHNQGGQDNRDSWSPAYCAELYTSPAGRQKLRFTALGWVYLPPMLIDQWLIHRTHFK